MEALNMKMQGLLMKTPERNPRNASYLSTPGLPPVGTPEKENMKSEMVAYPNSPQSNLFPVIVPHRIFVGGFPQSTTEHELRSYFERYGVVREVKIIRFDENEQTKRRYTYGFVTFGSEQEAKRVFEMNKAANGRAFKFQGTYLNVNEAIKKPSHKPRFGPAISLPPSGWILRENNGQLMPVYPNYTVLTPNQDYNVIHPQCVSVPSMVPVMIPPPVYHLPAPTQPPQQPPVLMSQHHQYNQAADPQCSPTQVNGGY